jgi:DNA-binding transcriptional regulator YdaS (Cro superfamily)
MAKPDENRREALQRAVKRAGGVTALSVMLDVSQPTVSNWIARNQVPVDPVNHVLAIEELTGVKRHELRPDVYPTA